MTTPQDYEYQIEQYKQKVAETEKEVQRRVDTLLVALRQATEDNERLRAENAALTRSDVVVRTAARLLSDACHPDKVADHLLAGVMAKPPLEKLRGLYAEELRQERLAGARALVDTLPQVEGE